MGKNRRSSEAVQRRQRVHRTRRAITRARKNVITESGNIPDTRETSILSGNPESNNTDLHEADRRAVELYKYAIKANQAEEERILSKVTDGSCKADRCDWSALTGGSDPADICPAITQIRELFNEATEKLLSLLPVSKLNEWIRLSREQQGSQEDVWAPIIPLLKEEAHVLREKLRLLLSVDAEESPSCSIQAGLLEAMLNATNADPVSEEDTELLKAIYRDHGAPVGVEVEVPFSSLWPHISKENVDLDYELSYFSGDSWRNYKSAEELNGKVLDYLEHEVQLKHMVRLDSSQVPDGAVPCRIAAVEKKTKTGSPSGGIRVIDDLKRNQVNSKVVKVSNTTQLPGAMTTAFIIGRIQQYWKQKGVNPAIVCIERDISGAFRHVPLGGSEQKYCINKVRYNDVDDEYLWFMHLRLPFGLSSSPVIWVRIYAGSVRLSKRIFCSMGDPEGIQLYIDDTGYFTVLDMAVRRLVGLLLLDEVLGFQNAYSKIRVGNRPHLLGYEWDLTDPSIGIPEEKRASLSEGIDNILRMYESDGKVEISALKSMTGRLSWLCHICRALRPRLANLYATMASADKLRQRLPHLQKIPLARGAVPDLNDFKLAITAGNDSGLTSGDTYLSRVPANFLIGNNLDCEEGFDHGVTICISDACPTGLAGLTITGGRAFWFMMELKNPLNSPVSEFVRAAAEDHWSHRDMGPLELLACLCCCLLAPNDRPAIFLCDNMACVNSINSMSSKSLRMKDVMRRISRAWRYGRGLRAFHLDSKSNWLADKLSRMGSVSEARAYMEGSTMTEVDMSLLLNNLQ